MKIKGTTKEAILTELQDYSYREICDTLADYLLKDANEAARITITPEQFDAFFKLRGFGGSMVEFMMLLNSETLTAATENENSKLVERRGRPRKTATLADATATLADAMAKANEEALPFSE